MSQRQEEFSVWKRMSLEMNRINGEKRIEREKKVEEEVEGKAEKEPEGVELIRSFHCSIKASRSLIMNMFYNSFLDSGEMSHEIWNIFSLSLSFLFRSWREVRREREKNGKKRKWEFITNACNQNLILPVPISYSLTPSFPFLIKGKNLVELKTQRRIVLTRSTLNSFDPVCSFTWKARKEGSSNERGKKGVQMRRKRKLKWERKRGVQSRSTIGRSFGIEREDQMNTSDSLPFFLPLTGILFPILTTRC